MFIISPLFVYDQVSVKVSEEITLHLTAKKIFSGFVSVEAPPMMITTNALTAY